MIDCRESNLRRFWRRTISAAFQAACLAATLLCVVVLALLLWGIFQQGQKWLDWDFLTHYASVSPEKSGIKAALAGSAWLIVLTALITVPVGVGAALYLEEYASAGRWRTIVQTNIANLAGVPSIVFGILGLGVFVHGLALQRSVLAGALTLSLVVLPIVILASQEALRSVPASIRHASYALGATRWQTVWRQVLPAATPGIMTGIILALSRALGEAAPLVTVGAAAFARFTPARLSDEYTALPIQIFNWVGYPQHEFQQVAAAGIIVLLAVLILMNATAVIIRYRFGRHIHW